MGITNREKVVLEKANSDTIELAFEQLLDNFNNSRFLGSQNYLKTSTVKLLEKEFLKNPLKRKKFLSKNSIEYISASALLHNIDAWTYFGHGISSLLKGDESTARHLFYYSELRASMSFLATQGIGIFSTRHIIANKNNKAKLVNEVILGTSTPGRPPTRRNENKQGTHEFTWEAFDHFIASDINITKIFDNFLVEDISLNYWLEKFGVTPSFRTSLGKDFLKRLSFDLNHFSKDRDARNEVSYRPSNIAGIPTFEFKTNLKQIDNIWKLSEPGNKKGEIKLDLILLTELLQMAFKKSHSHGFSYKRAHGQYDFKINKMLDDLGLPEGRKKELSTLFKVDQADIYSSLALIDINSALFNKGILYRSFIFIRLSNVFCNKLLKETPDIDKKVLEFWWKPLGLHFGLWDFLGEPEQFADLWQDLDDLKTPIEDLLNFTGNISTSAFWKANAEMGFVLSTCPRIGFWGLGI